MKKKAIAQIGFEFLSVVFAVLLALGLNSYKQELDFENESDLLRERIITEVIANKTRLDSVIIRNENTMNQAHYVLYCSYKVPESSGNKPEICRKYQKLDVWPCCKSAIFKILLKPVRLSPISLWQHFLTRDVDSLINIKLVPLTHFDIASQGCL